VTLTVRWTSKKLSAALNSSVFAMCVCSIECIDTVKQTRAIRIGWMSMKSKKETYSRYETSNYHWDRNIWTDTMLVTERIQKIE